MLSFELALKFVVFRKRPMVMGLAGIICGVAFFIITQAQTSGFESFFIKTILGTNGALRVSNPIKTIDPHADDALFDEEGHIIENNFYETRERTGISNPLMVREVINGLNEVRGISSVYEGSAYLQTSHNGQSVEFCGINWLDHAGVSNLPEQIIAGNPESFIYDTQTVILGFRIAQHLQAKVGDRVSLSGGTRNIQLLVSAIFESGVSQIDKHRVYMSHATAKSFLGPNKGGTFFQVSLKDADQAVEVGAQLQQTLHHRVVSWQEREKVWLDVFKALRFSSAITVSTILLLSGLGIFNVFAIMVIEKSRDIAILRAIGLSPGNISAVFLWQGVFLLLCGVTLGSLLGALMTWGISSIPIRIRGIFSADSFMVNWDVWHYVWAMGISCTIVFIASFIPARRASRLEPAKIIRETL